jgi:hypothetical protein
MSNSFAAGNMLIDDEYLRAQQGYQVHTPLLS